MSNKRHNRNKEPYRDNKSEVKIEEVGFESNNIDPIITNETVIGCVDDCSRLNIRVSPSIESDIVMVVDKGEKLPIYVSESTDDFYKTDNGYVMKKYISITSGYIKVSQYMKENASELLEEAEK